MGQGLKTAQVLLYTAALSGEPYLAAPEGSIPADCVWDLAFD